MSTALRIPWEAVTEDEARSIEKELVRECCSEHQLVNQKVKTVAQHWKTDDVVFELEDGQYAVVHLTGQEEKTPMFPRTIIYSSIEEILDDNWD